MAETNLERQLDRMRQDWDARARENARYYVATGRELWDNDGFFESGETTVAQQILTDMTNICQGKNPKDMRVIEIGCGAGRITRALARLFGEVHAVDISGEMVEMARQAVTDFPHATVYQNNGHDLTVLPGQLYDFAFSTIVFQHIPSREIVYSYVREVHRLLRPGAFFKFQVQGGTVDAGSEDTWVGVSFSDEEAVEMAQACGFEPSYRHGSGDQYFWLWFRRLEGPDAVDDDSGDAYEPRSWPHSAQEELEIACRRLRESEDRFTDLHALMEERTVWAQRLDREIEELTARAHRLSQELEAETALVARLGADLDRLAWAGPLDRRMHGALTFLVRVVGRAHRLLHRHS